MSRNNEIKTCGREDRIGVAFRDCRQGVAIGANRRQSQRFTLNVLSCVSLNLRSCVAVATIVGHKRKTLEATSAVAARVTDRLWEVMDMINVVEAREAAN